MTAWRRLVDTFPAWCVLVLALWATALAWYFEHLSSVSDARGRFWAEVRVVQIDLADRLGAYEQALRAGVSVFYSWPSVRRENWESFVENLQIGENYPGIQGIGFAEAVASDELASHVRQVRSEGFPDYQVWPEGERPIYTSIVYLEPFNWRNQRAFGYDMFTEPVRRRAMERARDTGMPSLSGMVKLVQETTEAVQAGFLLYLPVYRTPSPASVEQRRRELRGYVYSPFRMGDFMHGLLGDRERDIALEVFDGEAVTDDGLMYNTAPAESSPALEEASFVAVVPFEFGGHRWTLRFSSLPSLAIDREKPLLVLGGGIVVSLLLYTIAWSLAKNRAQAAEANARLRADIERREAVEAQLREKETSFRYLFEKNPNPMWVFDRESLAFLEVNDAAVAHYGYTAEEFRRMTIADLRPREDVPRLLSYVKSRTPGLKAGGEWQHITKDGRKIDVEITSYTLEFQHRDAVLVVARDVTESNQAEARLRQAQKMEAVGQLTGGVAHDFNNLLTVIIGNLDIATGLARKDSEIAAAVDRALSAAETGAGLIQRLLAFSRQQALQPENTDLNRVVTGMSDLLRRTLGADIEISLRLDDDLWPALADRGQVESALLNLAINARDAMPDGGKLAIETANAQLDADYAARNAEVTPGNYAVLVVSDTGSGMAPEVVERACEPFFTTKGVGKGSGLGLSMIYGFTKQSGGHLKIYSEPGHGTTVRLYLPRAKTREAVAPIPAAPGDSGHGTEVVLVVEDDPGVRQLAVAQLRGLGYQVLEAPDGMKAVALLQRDTRIDLLFTDVVMPGGMSGQQLAAKARELRPRLKVLFTSGYTPDFIAHQGQLPAGVFLLSKPYRRDDLGRKIREILDGEKPRSAR